MMKQYTKLPIPKGTAWEYKRFDNKLLRIIHWRIRNFFHGVWNIIRWAPTIYKDKDWDDYYITKILQKKIEHQRAYLVGANIHYHVDRDNFWMTVVLNLIERRHEDYYDMERYQYIKMKAFDNIDSENLDDYIAKYPGVKRRTLAKYKGRYKYIDDKDSLSLFMAHERQRKCDRLIFEILKQYSANWWN